MDRNFKIKAFCLILVLTLLSYSNSFRNQFVWDDEFLIVNNTLIRSFKEIPRMLSVELFHSYLVKSNYYRPLQVLGYMSDYFFFKLNPAGFHMTNILLHILNSILVLALLNLLTKDSFISLVGAILFSLHPAQVEAVTYISGRADLLLGIFLLSSLILYLKHSDYTLPKRNYLYLVSLLLFLLSLLSKELALVLPFVLILSDFFNKKIQPVKYLPYFAIEIVYLVMRSTIINFTGRNLFSFKDTLIFSPIKLFKVIITYAKIVILPINLHIGRLLPESLSVGDIILLILFALVFIICVTIYNARKRVIYFGIAWFWVVLFFQSNLFLRFFGVHTSEHFLYLPLIGFFLIIGFLLKRVYEKNKFLGKAILINLIVFYGLLTFNQNMIWKDPISLYRWTLKNSNHNFTIHNNLGLEYEKRGLFQEAMEEFKVALQFDPNYINSLINLGNVYFKLGLYKEAQEQYLKAFQLEPNSALLIKNYQIISKESINESPKDKNFK